MLVQILARAVLLDHRGPAVVHADDHRGRAALAREPLDDVRGGGQALAAAPDLAARDEAEKAGLAEPAEGPRGEGAAIDLGGAKVLSVDGPDRVAPNAHATYSITVQNTSAVQWPSTTRLVIADGTPSALYDPASWTSPTSRRCAPSPTGSGGWTS